MPGAVSHLAAPVRKVRKLSATRRGASGKCRTLSATCRRVSGKRGSRAPRGGERPESDWAQQRGREFVSPAGGGPCTGRRPNQLLVWHKSVGYRAPMTQSLRFLGLVFTLSLLGCSSGGRLTDSEIDRACALASRCAGTSSATCVRAVLNAREIADANGCASIFAETNRCYLSHNECTATARCETLSNQLLACGLATTDVGQPDAGPSDAGSCPSGFADLVFEGSCRPNGSYFFSNGLMHRAGEPLSCDGCGECTLERPTAPSCSARWAIAASCNPVEGISRVWSYTISADGFVEGTLTLGGATRCEATFSGQIR